MAKRRSPRPAPVPTEELPQAQTEEEPSADTARPVGEPSPPPFLDTTSDNIQLMIHPVELDDGSTGLDLVAVDKDNPDEVLGSLRVGDLERFVIEVHDLHILTNTNISGSGWVSRSKILRKNIGKLNPTEGIRRPPGLPPSRVTPKKGVDNDG